MSETKPPLVDIQGLTKHFALGKGKIVAVDDFSLQIFPGETVGLVGESGCGKSTVGRTLLRLQEPTAGRVLFDGVDLFTQTPQQMWHLRQQMQIIFQDPYASLNPRLTVGEIIAEGLIIHRLASGQQLRDRVAEMLEMVGLPADHANRYPHEFSGGQRQRIGIARALAVNPRFIVCDEPLSALDVSVQAQIVSLLQELREKMQLTLLFIAHDLSMVEYFAQRVAVMYRGRLVEIAPSAVLYKDPRHPYTQALLSAIPIPDPIAMHKRPPVAVPPQVPVAGSWQEVTPGHFVIL